jgi:hypothetical protein
MDFQCINKTKTKRETWKGHITSFINYGRHIEIRIESRSGILVLVGKTSQGAFACIPDYNAGCHLANLKDIFYSTEKLNYAMKNKVDAITVAYALAAIADKVDLI